MQPLQHSDQVLHMRSRNDCEFLSKWDLLVLVQRKYQEFLGGESPMAWSYARDKLQGESNWQSENINVQDQIHQTKKIKKSILDPFQTVWVCAQLGLRQTTLFPLALNFGWFWRICPYPQDTILARSVPTTMQKRRCWHRGQPWILASVVSHRP